jgi:transcriptional regulator with XRE-family HTH domain
MNKIKELRLKNHFSQDEMAETLHISQNAYSLIENGKTRLVDMERINLIAEKFGINPMELGLFETRGVTQNFNEKVENGYAAYIATLNTYNNELIQSMAA